MLSHSRLGVQLECQTQPDNCRLNIRMLAFDSLTKQSLLLHAMAAKINHARREHFKTSSGIELPVDFNPSNAEEIEYDRDLGDPGEFPYTRGIRPNMYRGRLWTMRQYAGYATAEESNARYKYLLSQGTTGLSVAFDLPTQIGLDSDDPLAAGEVGKVGVAIDSLEDMLRLFDEIGRASCRERV